MDEFLAIAQDLLLKGLARSENSYNDGAEKSLLMPHGIKKEKTIYEPEKPFEYPMTIRDSNIAKCSNGKPIPEESQKIGIVVSNEERDLVGANMEDVKGQISSMLERSGGEGEHSWKCTVCGKSSNYKQTVERHIETHIQGISYPCDQCGAIKRSSNALNKHVTRYHK